MKKRRIKTDWASLSLADDGNAIVCVKCNNTPCCMWFNSLKKLKQAIDSKKMLVKKWAIAVPRSSCILKPLTLPASDLAEAAKMIEFELPSLVPLPPDEIVYGCTLLNKQDNMLNVLACILKLNILNQHLEPYRAIGIEPQRIALSSVAIQNWFNTTNNVGSNLEISVFVNKHHCVVLAGINGNFQKVNELTLLGVDIAISSHKIIQAVLHQQDEVPYSVKKKIIVSFAGAEEYASEIEKLLRAASNGPICNKVNLVTSPQIICYEDGQYKHDSDDFSYEAVVATGLFDLATYSKLPHSNLLPQQYMRRYQQKASLFNYLFTGSLLLLLILLLWLSLWAMNWRIKRVSRVIESKIAPIENIASSVESKRQRVKAIQRQLSNRGQIMQIIEELYKYTPNPISISELRFKSSYSQTSIEIKGQADLLANAFEYTDVMLEADLLNKIQIVNAQQIPRLGGSVVEFKANCVIRND